MYALLEDLLKKEEYRLFKLYCHVPLFLIAIDRTRLDAKEREFVNCLKSHVDFLIASKITNRSLIAVEVDGYQYHIKEKQRKRDALKNSILSKLGIQILRFQTNGSGERERIENALNSLMQTC